MCPQSFRQLYQKLLGEGGRGNLYFRVPVNQSAPLFAIGIVGQPHRRCIVFFHLFQSRFQAGPGEGMPAQAANQRNIGKGGAPHNGE